MALANLLGIFDGPEGLIILLVVLLLFGGSKLPQLARSLGEAKRELDKGMHGEGEQPSQPPATPAPPAPEAGTVSVSREELERLRRAAGELPEQHEPPS